LILKTGRDLVTRLPDGTNTSDLIGLNLDGAKIKQIALDGGHDGVIQIRPNEMIGDVVAFRPEQIKSATGNRGTFDPANADIRFSRPDDAADVRSLSPEQVQLLQSLGMLTNEQADLLEDGSADAQARSAARRVPITASGRMTAKLLWPRVGDVNRAVVWGRSAFLPGEISPCA